MRRLTEPEIERLNVAIATSGGSECQEFWSPVADLAKAVAADDEEEAAALWFIARTFAGFVDGMGRANQNDSIWPDFTKLSDDEVDVLRSVLPHLKNEEAVARVADALWLARRDWKAGELAVDVYLRRAKEPEQEWPAATARYRRAVDLAASLNRDGDLYERAIATVEELLIRLNGEDPKFFSVALMEIVIAHKRRRNAKDYAALAEKAAKRAEAEFDFWRAQNYWQAAIRLWSLAGDRSAEISARTALGECSVHEATFHATRGQPSFMLAAHHQEIAIAILRKLPEMKDRVRELLRDLKEYEGRSGDEFKPIGAKFEIGDLVELARNAIRNKSLPEALRELASLVRSPSKTSLRAAVLESAKTYLAPRLFPEVVVSREGAKVGIRPPVGSEDERDQSGLYGRMIGDAAFFHNIAVAGQIEPARRQIISEHPIREADFLPLAFASGFVPPGREEIYAKALYAGMVGDFAVAVHLLLPQIEQSVRWLFQQRGIPTVSFKPDGNQVEKDLGTLLWEPEAEKIFGEDLHFDLLGLLVHPLGTNLRNDVSHGRVPPPEFESVPFIYCWWLTFRICFLTLPRNEMENAESDQEREDAKTD
ncbi:MAG: DUF4209 domain-containing protein [Acidobacteriota bacterium]|nr:DUF4209 domain-containing protein [Acidobacteriota bacterium]